jgi:hypothetical protein
MSHFTAIDCLITDMDALRAAIEYLGLSLVENAECRHYYGTQMKEYVIPLPGKYDAALERKSDGSLMLTADWYGGHVARSLGGNGDLLIQRYAVEKAIIEARRRGFFVSERQEGKDILLTVRDNDGSALKIWCQPGGKTVCRPEGVFGASCMKFLEYEKALGFIEEHHKTGNYYVNDEQQIVQAHFLCG